MKKLMFLEIQKYHLGKYVKIVFAVILCILLFLTISLADSMTDPEQTKDSYESILRMLQLLVTGSFLIFSSVLTGKYIIGEYTCGTIMLMFGYPIRREKIILAKLVLLVSFTAVSVLIGYIICLGYIFAAEKMFHVLAHPITGHHFLDGVKSAVCSSFLGGALSMLPYLSGIIRKSFPSAIVTAVITVCLMQPLIGRHPTLLSSAVKLGVLLLIIAAAGIFTFRRCIHEL